MSAALAYVPIPVEAVVPDETLDFDLYVQLNQKHVLYLRKGGVFSGDRLTKMREKNVKNLWIVADDEARYREQYGKLLDEAYELRSRMEAQKRAAIIYSSLTTLTEALFKEPAHPGFYYNAAEGAKRLTEFMLKDEAAVKLMLTVPKADKSVAAHGVSVGILAIAIAKKIGIGESKDLYQLALGCFLHDGGHYGKESVSFGKPVKSLTLEELKAHREHPMVGVRDLHDLKHFDHHVIKIILEHEEHCDGTGFPKGINEKQMHVYSVVASTANAFERLLSFEGETYPNAMKRFVMEKIGRHPLAQINALKAIIQSLG